MFAGSNAAGGYVIAGGRRIHLAPAIAKGRQWPRSNGWHGPYAETVTTRRGTMTHEMGHVLDNINSHTRDQEASARQFHRGCLKLAAEAIEVRAQERARRLRGDVRAVGHRRAGIASCCRRIRTKVRVVAMMLNPADIDWRSVPDIVLAGAVLDGIPDAITEAERRLAADSPTP